MRRSLDDEHTGDRKGLLRHDARRSAPRTTVTTGYVSSQSVVVSGLLTDQTYYYDVESVDHQGNAVRDDNGGLHYTFTTDRKRDVLLVIGDSTFDKKVRYTNAFVRTGWTYSIWEGAQASDPYVGDLAAGMASYKAVIIQPGLEQYPPVTDAARDSISKLATLGSRLAIYSHDVAWDFSDPTSPDYTAARLAWFNSEFHATCQVDPAAGQPRQGNRQRPDQRRLHGGDHLHGPSFRGGRR